MSKNSRPVTAFLLLAMVTLACAVPIPLPTAPPPAGGGTPTPPFSSDQIGTVVALTLTAGAPVTGEVTAPAPGAPGGPGGALPRTFYYLGSDSAGLMQVFRIERDGITQRQLTSESVSVNDYDVSLVDGSVAYVANNQLLLINVDGSDRRVLVDGGVMDPNNPFISNVSSPVFSPDGQTLAYGYQGLQMYYFSTGESDLIIENQIDDVGGGLFVPRELYSPERYSPDGSKLLITLGYYEGA